MDRTGPDGGRHDGRHRRKSIAVGVACVGCLAALPIWGDTLLGAGLLTFGAVLAAGRSRLAWLPRNGAGAVARRLFRVAVFFAALPFAPGIRWSGPPLAVAAGALVGLALLAPDVPRLRRSLDPAFLALLPRQSGLDAGRDLIVSGGSGVAQEYLYRGLLLLGLAPVLGWWAAPVVAALFVAEHLLQGTHGRHFDRWDVTVQVVLSLGLAALVLATESVLPAVVGHSIYNLPNVVQTVVRAHPSQRQEHPTC